MSNHPAVERLALAKVHRARQKRQALFSFCLLLCAVLVHFSTRHLEIILGSWTSFFFAAIRALFYGLTLLSIFTFTYVFLAYSSSSQGNLSKKVTAKPSTTMKKDNSAVAASILKSSVPVPATKLQPVTSAAKAVYTGALPPIRQSMTFMATSATKAYADNPRNYDMGGASDSLFGSSGVPSLGGGFSAPLSHGLAGAYTGGMATPLLQWRHPGMLSPVAGGALSSSVFGLHSTSKFSTSSIGMNSTTYGSMTGGVAGGKYLSPPVSGINSPGKHLSDLVGGTGRRHTPNAHDFIKSHDAVAYLDDLECVQGEWLNNCKHFIMQFLVQAYGEFSSSVNDIMVYMQQRNLAMYYFPGATNSIKDPQDFYNKVRKILMLESARYDIAISAGVVDINLQSLCRRLEDSDINIDRSVLHAYYSRYSLFCSPAVASDLLSSSTASSSSKTSSKLGSHSHEIADLIRVMHSKNWKSSRAQSSIESDLIVTLFINICHPSSSHSFSTTHSSNLNASTRYFASSVSEIKSCALGHQSCGLVRQSGNSRQANYDVYIVDGHHIDIVNIDAGRDNCYESIVTLLLMIVKFNTVVKEPVHQLMKNVFSEFQYVHDYHGLRLALQARGLFLRYIDDDDEGDD